MDSVEGSLSGLRDSARRWASAPDGRVAETRVRAALVDSPGWPEGWALLHQLLGAKFGRHALTVECRAAARCAWVSGPGDLSVQRMMGILAFESGQFRRAAGFLGRAVVQDRSPVTAWQYCRALLQTGEIAWISRFAADARRIVGMRGPALAALACAASMRRRDRAALRLLGAARRCPAATLPQGVASVPTAQELAAAEAVGRREIYRRVGLDLEVVDPPASGETGTDAVLMVSGDARYLKRFLPGFAASVRANADGMPIHVHVVGECGRDLLDAVSSLADAVTRDRSGVAMDRAYYTASRFLWVMEVADLWRRPVLVSDIDATVGADPRPILAALGDHDVACRMADHVLPWERTQVTALHLPDTDGGRKWADIYARTLAVRLLDGPLPYYSDQAVVWALTQATGYGDGAPRFRLADLPLTPWLRPANQSGIAGKSRELARE